MGGELDEVLAVVGPRLRALRQERRMTLQGLSAATGISVSTLSRLESGQRRPNLELLIPLARAHGVALDALVGAVASAGPGDPRVHARPIFRDGMTFQPLTRRPGGAGELGGLPGLQGLQAYKIVIPAGRARRDDDLRVHDGYEWLYVLSGRLRLVLGPHDLVLSPGEAAEFDTRVPHRFDCAGSEPVEILSLFGPQGERMHVRARPTKRES
jgi:transcriptional regulator with XRE-family HTH domain